MSCTSWTTLCARGQTSPSVWLVDMIYYMVLRRATHDKSEPADSEDLSIQGLNGNTASGNRGNAGVFKRDCLPYLLDNLPQELGLYPVWFTSVRWTVLSHTWTSLKGSGALASDTMTYYVNFCHEFIYDLTYDSCIKALVKIHQAGK